VSCVSTDFHMKTKFILSCCLLLTFCGLAQQNKSDSLLSLLRNDKVDTLKITHLNNLGWELMYNNPDTSIILGREALSLAEHLPSQSTAKKFHASAFENLGVYYQIKGDYPKALDYSLKALKVYEEILSEVKNPLLKKAAQKGVASCLLNVGLVYKDQNDNAKSLSYYLKALKIDEELGNKTEMAAALGNIGVVYYDLATASGSKINDSLYQKAFDNYFKVLKIAEELGNKSYQAIALGNIGNIYDDRSRIAKTRMKDRTSDSLCKKAFDYYFKALRIDEELGNKNGVARHFSNIGSLFTSTGKLKEAEFYLKKAIAIDDSTGAMNDLRQDEESLSQLYDTTGKVAAEKKQFESVAKYYKLSMTHFKKAMALKDTIFSQENRKELTRKELNFAFEKKEATMKAEHDKEAAVAAAENKKKNIIILSIAFGLLLVMIFAIYMLRAFIQKKNANNKITRQKEEIELQRNELSLKNQHITASINYAKRIQDAILPSREELSNHFPNHFVFFRPKDIVSGDFYWYYPISHSSPLLEGNKNKTLDAEFSGGVIFAVVDCTGHGVPGAFMSMIGNTLLNKIVNEQKIIQPAEILNHLQAGIVQALHQESRSQDDGMDISICLFNKEKNKIIFAGANHSMFIIHENSVQEIKGDIYSIGSLFSKKNAAFTQKEILLHNNSNLYFFTDGFADQVGEISGKRYLTKQLEKLLLRAASFGINEQKEVITKTFEDWRGNCLQIDDVLLAGIRT